MAGISQPGGAGTTIFTEDNANPDASLDGIANSYSLLDYALKGLASGDYIDPGFPEKVFRSRATIQNGDGAGVASTTIKDTDVTLIFDAGKTLATSLVGATGRVLELGLKIQGAAGKPSGASGCKLRFGAATTIRGLPKIYGSLLRSTAGLNIIPSIAGGEIINSLFEGTGFAIGQSSSGILLDEIYNLDLTKTGGAGAAVTNWGAQQAERVVVGIKQGVAGSHFFSTGARVRVRDIVFAGTPSSGDWANSNPTEESDLVEPVWSGNATQVTASTRYTNEWWRFLPIVSSARAGAAKLANVPIVLLDKDGVDLIGLQYTDSEGVISYNAVDPVLTIFDDVVKVRRGIGGVGAFAWEERGPFTARYNLDGAVRSDYLGTSVEYNFPRRAYGAGELQLSPVLDVVKLIPRTGSGLEEYRGSYT